jgi:hypothetical protein
MKKNTVPGGSSSLDRPVQFRQNLFRAATILHFEAPAKALSSLFSQPFVLGLFSIYQIYFYL